MSLSTPQDSRAHAVLRPYAYYQLSAAVVYCLREAGGACARETLEALVLARFRWPRFGAQIRVNAVRLSPADVRSILDSLEMRGYIGLSGGIVHYVP